jgi:hypothetical protein
MYYYLLFHFSIILVFGDYGLQCLGQHLRFCLCQPVTYQGSILRPILRIDLRTDYVPTLRQWSTRLRNFIISSCLRRRHQTVQTYNIQHNRQLTSTTGRKQCRSLVFFFWYVIQRQKMQVSKSNHIKKTKTNRDFIFHKAKHYLNIASTKET